MEKYVYSFGGGTAEGDGAVATVADDAASARATESRFPRPNELPLRVLRALGWLTGTRWRENGQYSREDPEYIPAQLIVIEDV